MVQLSNTQPATMEKKTKNRAQTVVPYSALHAERNKHKKTRLKLMKMRQQLDELQLAYFNVLAKEPKKNCKVSQPAPNPQKNVVDYIRWLVNEFN